MKVKITELKPHPLNERIYSLSSLDSLRESIEQVGLLEPISINSKTGEILSGHRRFFCVKSLGWKLVEVHKIDIKKGEEILTLIHFNRQRIKTTKELLNEYLELETYHKKKGVKKGTTIRSTVSKEIKVTDGQLARIIYIHKRNPEFISLIDKGILTVNQAYMNLRREEDDKKSRDSIKEYQSSKISNKESFKFYQKSSHNMKEVKSSSCDLVMCSPPFWRLRSYTDKDVLGSESTSEEYVQNIVNHLTDEVVRILLPTGSFFIEIGDTFLNGNLQNIPHRIAIEFQKRGLIQRNSIIVARKNPKPSSSKKNLTPSYSFIFHFVKSMDYHYVLSLTKNSTNTKPSLPPRHRNLNGDVSLNVTPYLPNSEGRNMGDFFTEDIVRVAVSNQRYSEEIQHPAQYPEQLVHLILNSVVYLPFKDNHNYSPLCCDPFAGNLGLWKGIKWFNDNLGTKIRFVGYDIKKWF